MRNWIATLLLFSLFILSGVASGQQSPVLSLKTRIPLTKVDGRMDHFGVDVKGQRLFATANANRTIEVIDLRAGRQVHTITDLDTPQGAFYDADTNRLFVANEGDGTVQIFDGTTFQIMATVKLTADADNVRYDARGKHIVVGYGGEKLLNGKVARPGRGGALAILDSTGQKTGEIPTTDAHPESFQLETTGTRVFVNIPDSKEVEVADLVKGTVLAYWPITGCTDNFPMTLDEPHHRLFVACRIPPKLLVFDTENGKTVASLETLNSDDIFYDASKGRIYVIGTGFIDAFQQNDADHYVKIGRYPTAPTARTGFFVPEWGELFVGARHQGEQSEEILVYETK